MSDRGSLHELEVGSQLVLMSQNQLLWSQSVLRPPGAAAACTTTHEISIAGPAKFFASRTMVQKFASSDALRFPSGVRVNM